MEPNLHNLLLCCLVTFLFLWPSTSSNTDPSPIAKSGCSEECGNVNVPYPFGIGETNCAKNESFFLNCTGTSTSSTTLLLNDIPVLNISVQDSSMIISLDVAYDCYDGSQFNSTASINLKDTPFAFSDTRNKLTAVGCDTVALMADPDNRFMSGCNSFCNQPQVFTKDSSCSGIGCCQTPLPKNVDVLAIALASISNHTTYSNSSPCSYAFLVETQHLDLSDFDLSSKTPLLLSRPVVLDWVLSGAQGCENACGANTDCVYSDNALGYYCKCKDGNYVGNPYLQQGCQDIDECKEPKKYPCHGSCKNINGDYTCSCPIGMYGDAKVSCQLNDAVKICTVVGSITFLAIIGLLIFIICKRRKRERNFIKNGGMMLKHQRVRIFSKAELEKATNNFDNATLLGEGGFGSVYKGVLEGNLHIAVKKPKDENKIEVSKDFHHEIATVSQVNHKNVVKLLGLCLETKVPLLVYEFISNGTLFQHIHDKRSNILRSWKNRLRVAAETALALDYLHSLADPPIIHRDVKSMNILLDDHHTAKVSDFGASVLISPGESAIGTNIQGTFGYLDPEYLMTSNLTEKSDVYSFGVVLMELLTGEKPTSMERSRERRNIVQYFISVAESEDLFMILGFEVGDEAEKEEIEEVAEVAKRCLNASGIKRPSMKEVAEQLAGLMKLNQSFWAQQNGSEESEHLLAESSYHFGENDNAKAMMGQPDSYTERCFDIQSSMPSI